jgi:hypothetical protein
METETVSETLSLCLELTWSIARDVITCSNRENILFYSSVLHEVVIIPLLCSTTHTNSSTFLRCFSNQHFQNHNSPLLSLRKSSVQAIWRSKFDSRCFTTGLPYIVGWFRWQFLVQNVSKTLVYFHPLWSYGSFNMCKQQVPTSVGFDR